MKITGSKQVEAKLKRLADKFPNVAGRALRIEAELVMTDSKKNFVPVDLGVLRSSGFVEDPVHKGKNISVTMGFGGPAKDYALAVHETPSGFDPPSWVGVTVQFSPRGRGAKYLERPLMDAIPGIAERIGARLDIEKII